MLISQGLIFKAEVSAPTILSESRLCVGVSNFLFDTAFTLAIMCILNLKGILNGCLSLFLAECAILNICQHEEKLLTQ